MIQVDLKTLEENYVLDDVTYTLLKELLQAKLEIEHLKNRMLFVYIILAIVSGIAFTYVRVNNALTF